MTEKRRVLITGVARFLGLHLARRLAESTDTKVVGVDLDEPPEPIDNFEFVRADIRSPLIARVVEATRSDTIVHTNIGSGLSRLGGRSRMKENNVIGTMQLLAAAQRAENVRTVVVRSSTAVYGSAAGEPSLIPEDHAARQVELSGYGKDCAEAETTARDFARRRPDVTVVILRTQNVLGPSIRTSMTEYLSLPVIPTALGFDPRLQFVHEDDAVDAIQKAFSSSSSGIFNIAGSGVLYLSQAIRMLGRVQLPLPLPGAQVSAEVLRRAGLIDFSPDQLPLLLYGRVVDTRRAEKVLGFVGRHSSEQTLIDFRDNRREEGAPIQRRYESWERELFEYLRRHRAAPSEIG